MDLLEEQVNIQLAQIGYPPSPWIPSTATLDVAIIGGGMAGLCAAFALMRQGISNIQIYDASPAGFEGPWCTCARMLTLRSGKQLMGPALDLPALTFQAWYTTLHGEQAWQQLYKIPTPVWMEYLRWYRKVLKIPVLNGQCVDYIKGDPTGIALHFTDGRIRHANKVVIATGRGGFGAPRVPDFLHLLPKACYAHTSEPIDFKAFKNKRVAILGSGASGFDAAAEALEKGAAEVTMLTRRERLPDVNKFADATYPGFAEGYCRLPDASKIKIMENARKAGTPPPFESLNRVSGYPQFKVLTGFRVSSVRLEGAAVSIASDESVVLVDFLVAATGYVVDGSKDKIVRACISDIMLWKDKHPSLEPPLALYPYLGSHYQLIPKEGSRTTWLSDVYCFNYAASMSHAQTSGDIPDISIGAERLAKGVAADFFTRRADEFVGRFLDYDVKEFDARDYPCITHE